MASVTWSPESLKDLEQIVSKLSRESPQAAEELAEDFIAMSEQLRDFPLLGRVFPEANREDVRVLIVKKSSPPLQSPAWGC